MISMALDTCQPVGKLLRRPRRPSCPERGRRGLTLPLSPDTSPTLYFPLDETKSAPDRSVRRDLSGAMGITVEHRLSASKASTSCPTCAPSRRPSSGRPGFSSYLYSFSRSFDDMTEISRGCLFVVSRHVPFSGYKVFSPKSQRWGLRFALHLAPRSQKDNFFE